MIIGHEWAIRSVKGFAAAVVLTLALSLGTVIADAAPQASVAKHSAKKSAKKKSCKPAKKAKSAAAPVASASKKKATSKKKKKATCKKKKKKASASKGPTSPAAPKTAPTPPAPPTPPVPPVSSGLTVSSNGVLSDDDDAPGFPSRLVFSTFAVQDRAGHSVSLHNATGTSVVVTSLSFGGASPTQFQLCSAAPTTIDNGATADICVAFRPTPPSTRRVVTATLQIATSEGGAGYTIELRGLNTGLSAGVPPDVEPAVEGYDEALLQNIFDAFGYATTADFAPGAPPSNPGNVLFLSTLPSAQGDEVVVSGTGTRCATNAVAPYYKRLDPSKPVTLRPMARYSGIGGNGSQSSQFGWYDKGSASTPGPLHDMFRFSNGNGTGGPGQSLVAASEAGYGENQKLLPDANGQTTFIPSGSFGIYARGAVSGTAGNPSGAAYTDDALNPDYFSVSCSRMFRTYPAKDASGFNIPGVYLVGLDVGNPNGGGKTWDYQDEVFMLVNAVPENN